LLAVSHLAERRPRRDDRPTRPRRAGRDGPRRI